MINFITNNLATIIICAVLGAVVGMIIARMIKNKRAGKSSCGCGCSTCAMHDACHQEQKK